MKVFYFILFLASASGLEYGPNDEDALKIYLKGTQSGRSAHGCTDKMFTVNGKEFSLLFNDAKCTTQDRLRGSFSKIIHLYYNL